MYYSDNREIALAELVGVALGRRAQQADGISTWANSAAAGQAFDLFMQQLLKEALKRSKGRQAEACRWLGISKSRFSYRLKQYRIDPQDYT